ncbi:MAG: phosphohydrolase [Candidatus Krumholzibacteriota bacterium]|nr:phosphohydrolase [Candidatus Krumholzibacteriota bacterium]
MIDVTFRASAKWLVVLVAAGLFSLPQGTGSHSQSAGSLRASTGSLPRNAGLQSTGGSGIQRAVANVPPNEPVLVAPADGASSVPLSAALRVNVSDPDGDSVTVAFIGRLVSSSPHPPFSLITIPDTQFYSSTMLGGWPEMFRSQTRWAVDKMDSLNIAFVAHVGDVVQLGDMYYTHWDSAWSAMELLERPSTTGLPYGLPYSIAIGNHDNPSENYNRLFGVSHFEGRSYYGGHYGSKNDSNFSLFSASGLDFIVLVLDNIAAFDPEILAWGDSVLAAYPERPAIVSSHNLIGPGDPGPFSDRGQRIYDALKDNPNLFLMICGHAHGESRRTDTYNGHTVHTVMTDYQSREYGGSGWMRITRFFPDENVMRAATYSPWLDQWETDADSSSQFSLPIDILPSTDWQYVGSAEVPSGSPAEVEWDRLLPYAEYEWFAIVIDGEESVSGPAWRFSTGSRPAVVRAVSPDGSEKLYLDHTVALEWLASDDVEAAAVDLLLSRTGREGPFETIASGIANTGSFPWTVTGPETQDAFFKVAVHDEIGQITEDASNAAFTIKVYDPTGIEPGGVANRLDNAYPNPFNPVTTIRYSIASTRHVSLRIYTASGELVRTLVDETQAPVRGGFSVSWDGRDERGRSVSSGVYFCKLAAGDFSRAKKLVLLK